MKNKRNVTSENDLKAYKKEDDYIRTRQILDNLKNISLIFMWLIAIMIIFLFISDSIFRDFIVEQLKTNFIAIILFSIQALGLRNLAVREK